MGWFSPRRRAGRGEAKRVSTDLVIEPGSSDEPPIGADIDAPGIRWELMFALFARMIAMIWLAKGIGFWAIVMGLGDVPLADEPPIRQALIVAFSIVNCVAGVGMWLLSPWGKSLWVFVVVTEILLGLSGFGDAVGLTSASGSGLALFCFFVLAFAVRRRQLGDF